MVFKDKASDLPMYVKFFFFPFLIFLCFSSGDTNQKIQQSFSSQTTISGLDPRNLHWSGDPTINMGISSKKHKIQLSDPGKGRLD
ncbi:hypothetical protein QG37_04730 [Candidozyma auris]|uniref:Uncharacterized protein n=1 Tax=Candidozyma auris TaxID=498019 RepID=A0A0L0NWG5_CANAR|nr:hypothetical protein QG37_04730 [[Candida] auris]